MTRHNKKEKIIKHEEKVKYSVEPWPNLPQQLLNLIGKQHPDLMQNISFHGVAKSWRAGPKHCSVSSQLTWLELCDKDQQVDHTLNISFRPGEYSWYSKRPRYNPWTRFHGCSHGLIVAGGKDPAEYCLLIPTARNSFWSIPPWDATIPFKLATLSTIPSNNYKSWSVLVLTGCSYPLFVACHPGYPYKWMKQESTLLDPNCSKRKLMQLTNAIGFVGKFYAISLQGTLVVIEEIESKFQITKLSRSRAVPSVFSKHLKEYLVESNGDILLIFLISEQSTRKVDEVEVFKLQMDDLSWLKLDNLGNRTVFAGTNCCMSVNASQLGCRSNCVYFNEHATDIWKFYEMGSDTILSCFDDYGSETKSPLWEEPIEENKFLSFLLESGLERNVYLLGARDLKIGESHAPQYCKWTSLSEYGFPEVAKLKRVRSLDIHSKIRAGVLSPRTSSHWLWKHILEDDSSLMQSYIQHAKLRDDDWFEVELCEYYTENEDDCIEIHLKWMEDCAYQEESLIVE
ncbi:hypothetical protein HAX54_035103 [Datura stramonium]|uniref:KIB1-4 beta-propeller domain-containing protein n=1 Tax=Datura stramonium TaxID=4076 RepID=A0ABS8SF86_DATST|nr:hypothetical protein [Datura stramonium]